MNEHEAKVQALLDEVVPTYAQLSEQAALAEWEAACNSSDANEQAFEEAMNAVSLFLSDQRTFDALTTMREWPDLSPDLARQVDTLYRDYFSKQFSADELRRLNAMQTKVQSLFHRHRAELSGKAVTDNQLNAVLESSTDSDEVRAAWLASKSIGRMTAEPIRELAHLRNELAARRGFGNYQAMSLFQQELDTGWLFGLLDELKTATDEPFRTAKAQLDEYLANRFQVSVGDLMPWHYANPFFQEANFSSDADLTPLLANHDVVATAEKFYQSIGIEVRQLLLQSDLYERDRKNQHAFCTNINRNGDVRILCNVRPNNYWLNTMVHELGHAVYDDLVPRTLPFLLRICPDIASTEAIALMFEGSTTDPAWVQAYLGLSEAQAEEMKAALRYKHALGKLVFARWGLVMVYFERDFYANPDQDLNALWWNHVTSLQGLQKPEGRDEPDYAAKYHIGCAPVYYHNYILGHLIGDQLRESILAATGASTFTNHPGVGTWLKERYFAPGNQWPMPELVKRSTGQPLSAAAFARAVTL